MTKFNIPTKIRTTMGDINNQTLNEKIIKCKIIQATLISLLLKFHCRFSKLSTNHLLTLFHK